MPATIAAAKADLETRFGGLTNITLFDHEPGSGQRGRWITISTAAITPDFWRIAIRVYVDTSAGAKQAQDQLDELVPLVEAHLLAGSYGPLDWAFDVQSDAQIVAGVIVDVGREDYF